MNTKRLISVLSLLFVFTMSFPIDKKDIPAMITTRWGQGEPFNNAISAETSMQCVTGDIAVAIAQIMKFHEWPEHGTGVHEYRTSKYQDPYYVFTDYSRDISGHSYDWANMQDSYVSGSYTDAQAGAVAELMFDAGVAMNSVYATGKTSSDFLSLQYVMTTYFGFDAGIRYYEKGYWDDAQWEDMIYSELAAGRPVICGSHIGECFICDGYQASTGMFHFNMGWGEDSERYISLTNPTVEKDGEEYRMGAIDKIVCGIQRPCGGKAVPDICLFGKSRIDVPVFHKDEFVTYDFSFGMYRDNLDSYQFGFLWNTGFKESDVLFTVKYTDPKTGKTYYARSDNDLDNKKHFDGLQHALTMPYPVEYRNLTLKNLIEPDMPLGVYRISLAYKAWEDKDDESVPWTDVKSHSSIAGYADFRFSTGAQEPFFCGFESDDPAWNASLKTGTDRTDVAKVDYNDDQLYRHGVSGGVNMMYWSTGGQPGDDMCQPGESYLTVRGFKLVKGKSYRLTFYVKSQNPMGCIEYGVFDGRSEPLAWDNITRFGNGWNCVAKTFLYTGETTGDACIGLSFLDPSNTYYVDAISIQEAYIQKVSVMGGDLIGLQFGYETNIGELSGELPDGSVTVRGYSDSNTLSEIPVLSAEYYEGNTIMVYLDDDIDYYNYGDLTVDFINPEDPDMQLRFKDGTPVPDLYFEPFSFKERPDNVSSTTIILKSSVPAAYSTDNSPYLDLITVGFYNWSIDNFLVYDRITASMIRSDGYSEEWVRTSEPGGMTVTFARKPENSEPQYGVNVFRITLTNTSTGNYLSFDIPLSFMLRSGVMGVKSDAPQGRYYDLLGRTLGVGTRGIVVLDGRKVLVVE